MDFVTNSSSSSFLLGRKGDGSISKEGKEKIADILTNKYLKKVSAFENLAVDNIEAHDSFKYRSEEEIEAAKSALTAGYELEEGYSSWDESDYQMSKMLESLLDVLKDEDNYCVIAGDLSW